MDERQKEVPVAWMWETANSGGTYTSHVGITRPTDPRCLHKRPLYAAPSAAVPGKPWPSEPDEEPPPWPYPKNWPTDTAPGQYKPQEGTWTLTAPDGQQWQADHPLKALRKESNARIPAAVQLARIAQIAAEESAPHPEESQDARRYRWLRNNSAGQMEHPIAVTQEKTERGMVYVGPLTSDLLDAAIDAAIAAKE